MSDTASIERRDDDPIDYNFVELSEGLASALIRAAEDQVERAQAILERTHAMADSLRAQADAQAREIAEMTDRFKQFGQLMIAAHHKLNGDHRSEPVAGKLNGGH